MLIIFDDMIPDRSFSRKSLSKTNKKKTGWSLNLSNKNLGLK